MLHGLAESLSILHAHSCNVHLTHASTADSCCSAEIGNCIIFGTATVCHKRIRQTHVVWMNLKAENTHLIRKGKYHCTADLLFDRLGFGQTSKSVYSFIQQNSWIQTSQTGSQPYNEISPYEVSECSLLKACFKGEQSFLALIVFPRPEPILVS